MLKLTYTILNCILRIESTLFSLDVPVTCQQHLADTGVLGRFLHKQGPKA